MCLLLKIKKFELNVKWFFDDDPNGNEKERVDFCEMKSKLT